MEQLSDKVEYTLISPCHYSFQDLMRAASRGTDTTELYGMSQDLRNEEVKKMCADAGWYWRDVSCGGVVYTAFSPERKISN